LVPIVITSMSLTTKSGQRVAPLFYGTAWKKASTTALVALALQHGFRAIDTACQPRHYNEELVGEAVSKANIPRQDLFLQTKFTMLGGQDPNNVPYDADANLEEQVRQSFAKSLQNLRTDYLDALLLHSPARTLEDNISILSVLNEFKSKGAVRHLGISNIYSISALKTICDSVPRSTVQIIQNRFYPDTGYDVEIRQYCKDNGMTYQSFWTLTGNPHIVQSRLVQRIAAKRGMTPEGVFYRFCIQEGITVLDGTKSEQHMDEDLSIATQHKFALEEDDMKNIRAMLR
jgi:diketogulonate reductase-like aldo/keto reductase